MAEYVVVGAQVAALEGLQPDAYSDKNSPRRLRSQTDSLTGEHTIPAPLLEAGRGCKV